MRLLSSLSYGDKVGRERDHRQIKWEGQVDRLVSHVEESEDTDRGECVNCWRFSNVACYGPGEVSRDG